MNQEVYVACNFKSLVEIKGFLKISGSHIHCTSGNIFETVQNTTDNYDGRLTGNRKCPIKWHQY